MKAIRTENLTKCYKDITAVDRLNLEIPEGELFCLLGVNGAGKTTTIKMLSGLTKPTAGDAYLMGNSICRDAAAVKACIAVSPQETAIAPGLTVKENLELLCGIHGISREERQGRIARLCQLLGLEAVLSRKAGKLSGGWQRRLSIAMALVSRPKILFLDEPTLGLTTHYMEEAEALADRIGIMKDGRLLLCDTVAGIKETTGADTVEQAFVRIVKGELQ